MTQRMRKTASPTVDCTASFHVCNNHPLAQPSQSCHHLGGNGDTAGDWALTTTPESLAGFFFLGQENPRYFGAQ